MSASHWPRALAGLVVVLALALALFPPEGISPTTARALALCLVAIVFFATGIMPEHLSAIGFFVLAMLLALAPPATVFAGFLSSAWWLVIGGMFIGLGVQSTGLGDRIARRMIGLFGGSYGRVMAGLVATSFLLMILMPSVMGRVMILVPLVVAFAARLGFAPGSRGYNGMIIVTGLTSFMASAGIMTGNIANMVLVGGADTLHGIKITYGAYLWAQFPVTAVLKSLTIGLVCWRLFRETPAPVGADEAPRPWSNAERRMAAILGISLALWTTDFWHRLDPGWIGLAAGFVCFLPRIGVLPYAAFQSDLKLGPAFYTAGIMGVGAVLAHSGGGEVLAKGLLSVMPLEPGATQLNYNLLYGMGTLLGLVTNQLGLPAVLTPLAGEFATATGLPLFTVLMIVVLSNSLLLFPYQTAPLVVALQLAKVSFMECTRATMATAALTVAFLVPVNYFWWRLIGLL